MNVLIICSGTKGFISPFIEELYRDNWLNSVDYFLIRKKGVRGYISEYFRFLSFIINNRDKFDIIHAHYGLSGILPFLQFIKPYVVTYHGSDINNFKVRFISKLVSIRARKNIFVEKRMAQKLSTHSEEIIPCGVDLNIFYERSDSTKETLIKKYRKENIWILFSSSFNRIEKNPKLAISVVRDLRSELDCKLIELKGYSRTEVAELMNISDCGLLISEWEGSPQFIKEAVACNLPLVSVDVGDVKQVLRNYPNYILTEKNIGEIQKSVRSILYKKKVKFSGEVHIQKLGLDLKNIQDQYNKMYENIN